MVRKTDRFEKRSPEWNDLKTVLFEKRCFPSVDGEKRYYLKTMTSPQQHHLAVDHSNVRYMIADRRFQMASLLIAVIVSLLTLLENLLRQLFLFFKKITKYNKSFLSSLGSRTKMIKNGSVEARQNLDGSGKDQDELQNLISVAGQL